MKKIFIILLFSFALLFKVNAEMKSINDPIIYENDRITLTGTIKNDKLTFQVNKNSNYNKDEKITCSILSTYYNSDYRFLGTDSNDFEIKKNTKKINISIDSFEDLTYVDSDINCEVKYDSMSMFESLHKGVITSIIISIFILIFVIVFIVTRFTGVKKEITYSSFKEISNNNFYIIEDLKNEELNINKMDYKNLKYAVKSHNEKGIEFYYLEFLDKDSLSDYLNEKKAELLSTTDYKPTSSVSITPSSFKETIYLKDSIIYIVILNNKLIYVKTQKENKKEVKRFCKLLGI